MFRFHFQATRVFSSAKYPGPPDEEKYNSVYNTSEEPSGPKRGGYKLRSRHEPVDEKVDFSVLEAESRLELK